MKYAIIILALLLSSCRAVGAGLHPDVSTPEHWYPQECCAREHCHPVPCEAIQEHGSFLLFDGLEFSGGMIKPSKDNQCHACIVTVPGNFPKHPICIFVHNNA